MEAKKLKKKLVDAINSIEDESLLKVIDVIIEREEKFDYTITPAQERELIRRSNSIKNGTAKLTPWNDVKKELNALKGNRGSK